VVFVITEVERMMERMRSELVWDELMELSRWAKRISSTSAYCQIYSRGKQSLAYFRRLVSQVIRPGLEVGLGVVVGYIVTCGSIANLSDTPWRS